MDDTSNSGIDNGIDGNGEYVLVMFITIIIIIIPRQESYLNTVARTYMMELGAEMLESIRDEMLPLAEKWLPFDLSCKLSKKLHRAKIQYHFYLKKNA